MGIELNTLGNIITTQGTTDVTAVGKKINLLTYKLEVGEVGQTIFTIPFIYYEGNDIAVYVNTRQYVRGKDWEINGSVLTWTCHALDVTDNLEIYG